MRVIDRPSPNFGPRPPHLPIDMLVLHYTGMADADSALARLADPAAEVSAHYLVEEDGTIHRLVEEKARAWHAGESFWAGERDINSRSIGIELVNPGHDLGYRPFPEAQMAALEDLALDILSRHPIPAQRVLGHSDVAPSRKRDPGELFDWASLARAGIGLWPEDRVRIHVLPHDFGPGDSDPLIAEAQGLLTRYGYEVERTGTLDPRTVEVLTAFQRHYRTWKVDGCLDGETLGRLAALVERISIW